CSSLTSTSHGGQRFPKHFGTRNWQENHRVRATPGAEFVSGTRPETCVLASGGSGARVPGRLCVGASRHLHQWLRRREIRTRAGVRSNRGAKVGPAAAAEIATVPDISPELLGRVTLTAGLAERDRMIPASREEQRPLPNEQHHGVHPRPQARACQEPRRKKFCGKL